MMNPRRITLYGEVKRVTVSGSGTASAELDFVIYDENTKANRGVSVYSPPKHEPQVFTAVSDVVTQAFIGRLKVEVTGDEFLEESNLRFNSIDLKKQATTRQTLTCIDSHTGGEPTRIVIEGAPHLGSGTVAEKLAVLRENHDWVRTASVLEPRGSDVLVGALLVAPQDETCNFGVIFFNNSGYLGMCGHGTIGLIESLAYLGRIQPGTVRIETPVGVVEATYHPDRNVSLQNIYSYRHLKDVELDVEGWGKVTGDVAWGGNWFFLVHWDQTPVDMKHLDQLTLASVAIRHALSRQNVTGEHGEEIDHVELFGPGVIGDSKNFVLCPGLAYDRSPCGTGTSAKLACLYADGLIKEAQIWRQESIVGTVFEGSVVAHEGGVIPTISGRAYVTGEITCVMDPEDNFKWGIIHV